MSESIECRNGRHTHALLDWPGDDPRDDDDFDWDDTDGEVSQWGWPNG